MTRISRNHSFTLQMLLTLLLLSMCAAVGEAQKLHPKVKGKSHEIRKVIVLPAAVSYGRVGVKGAETRETEAVKIEPQLERGAAQEFTHKKMTVLSSPFTEQALAEDKNLRMALADMQGKFDELLVLMSRKQKDVEKGRFSLGDKVLLINPDDQADAFIFIRAIGSEPSKGMKALSILSLNPFGLMPISTVWVTLVDARSGEVLALKTISGFSNLKKGDEKGFEKMFAGSFKNLADASISAKGMAQKP